MKSVSSNWEPLQCLFQSTFLELKCFSYIFLSVFEYATHSLKKVQIENPENISLFQDHNNNNDEVVNYPVSASKGTYFQFHTILNVVFIFIM